MKIIRNESRVRIEFVIRWDNGSLVGTSDEKTVLTFNVGEGKMIKALEEKMLGMKEGESRKITLSPDEGYGQYKKEMVLRVDRNEFGPDMELKVGRSVQYQGRAGERVNFFVNEVNDKSVTIDGNHPLAGLELTYEIDVVSID